MWTAFIYGILLAIGLIIPLGVQNMFIFNQGATQVHLLKALPSVITAFVCDSLLILGAVLGISVIVLTVPWVKTIIILVGSLFLSYMGWLTWKAKNKEHQSSKPLSTKQQIGFAASVSLLNPHALLDTIGVIGTNSLNFIGQEKWAFTLACIFVSFSWFLSLSILGRLFNKIDKTGTGSNILNKISALIMWMTAIYLAMQLVLI